jgi:hypothetical protein
MAKPGQDGDRVQAPLAVCDAIDALLRADGYFHDFSLPLIIAFQGCNA